MPDDRGDAGQVPAPSGRVLLEPVAERLRQAGFYAYLTLDPETRWVVCCDTDAGHVDVRAGDTGLVLEVWDTSPGLFWGEEDERRREARERLARVSLPAVARGMLAEGQQAWWDEADHGIGVRLGGTLPWSLADRVADVAKRQLAALNDLIALVETRLTD